MSYRVKQAFLAISVAVVTNACLQVSHAEGSTAQFSVTGYPATAQTMKFNVYLPLRNSNQLDQLIADQSSPDSPQYRHFLSVKQFRARFGPSEQAFKQATEALRAAGFQVDGRQSQSLMVRGSASNIEKTFGARLATVRYRDGHAALKSLTTLKLPAALAQAGAQIVEFSPKIRQHVHSIKSTTPVPDNRDSPVGNYWFTDLKQAYDFPSYETVNGAGQTIGIVISSDYSEDDINTYFAHEKLETPTIIRHSVLGGAPFSPDSDGSFEAELDIEQVGGMAPKATIVVYNIPDLSDPAVIAGYTAVVEDDTVDIVNSSFGGCEKFYTAEYNNGTDNSTILRIQNDLFRQGNSQGITFVASSGDNGALACPEPAYLNTPPTDPPSVVGKFIPGAEFPASSPYVTAVGGTNLVTTYDPPSLKSEYVRENAFYDPLVDYDPYGTGNLVTGGVWGSGGGESIFFHKPKFQQLVDTGTQNRAVPDLSLHMGGCVSISVRPCGEDRSAVVERFAGAYVGVHGTSASSPDFAGLLALKEQGQGGGRFGNENYDIYTLASLNDASPAKFYRQDIPGNNGLFDTHSGYNEVLGNGTVIGKNFVLLPYSPSAGDPQTPSNP